MQLTLLEYLQQSAARVPNKTAFADENERLSFATLLSGAQSIGTAIAHLTSATNRPCVILSERCAATIMGFQGILMSGNYYVPLDSKMPMTRLRQIIAEVSPPLVLCREAEAALARQAAPEACILTLEDARAHPADLTLLQQRQGQVLDIDPAYMIFTSGSTGAPKGIVVAHRSVIDFCDWMADFCGITEDDIMGNQAPFYFDLSVKDIYMTLKLGASCEIVPQKHYVFPLLLLQYLEEKQVTTLLWATSAFHLVANSGALLKCAPASLRLAALGGEAMQAKQVNLWKAALPQLTIINLYGPTEVTVDCTGYVLDRTFVDGETIPIGTACRNKQILLLDETLMPVPDGTAGEICVRGTGLARGYFRDAEKTAAAFVQNPLHFDYPDVLYRTGDLAVRDADGLLRFLSRADGQIKHMGYRIELGEIETALAGLSQVDAAICLYDAQRSKIVCVYTGQAARDTLAVQLRTLLPKYMLPNVYHQLDAMPLNANGKIDRVRLRTELIDGTNS